MEALRHHFRPEFLNRLDEIVVYRRLGREQIRAIVDIQLARLAARLAARELELEVEGPAKDFLAEVGWDPQFGARPLKRALQKHLEDGLARRVIAGDFAAGDVVLVKRGSDGLVFEKKPVASAQASGGRVVAQA
jgi:ATP-dependent Clp protease ATP-binding subunit ClpB